MYICSTLVYARAPPCHTTSRWIRWTSIRLLSTSVSVCTASTLIKLVRNRTVCFIKNKLMDFDSLFSFKNSVYLEVHVNKLENWMLSHCNGESFNKENLDAFSFVVLFWQLVSIKIKNKAIKCFSWFSKHCKYIKFSHTQTLNLWDRNVCRLFQTLLKLDIILIFIWIHIGVKWLLILTVWL